MTTRKEYWDHRERKIFLFLFAHTREFFINDSAQRSDWKYYDGHYRGCYELTRKAFEGCKREEIFPPLFLLETVTGTRNDALPIKLAWMAYFEKHGYSPIAGPNMMKLLDQFDESKSEFYTKIQDLPLENIICEENNLLPDFRRVGKSKRTERSALKPGTHQITLRMKDKNFQKLKEKAQEYGVSMTEYALQCVKYGGVIEVDVSFLADHLRGQNRCEKVLKGLLSTYLYTGEYVPSDMERLQEICDRLIESNRQVKEEFRHTCRRLSRMKWEDI